jgi:hypothetical protein
VKLTKTRIIIGVAAIVGTGLLGWKEKGLKTGLKIAMGIAGCCMGGWSVLEW